MRNRHEEPSTDVHTPRIIIVNDELTQLTFLSNLLRKEGMEVLPFQSATSALEAMDPGHPPDLIITDLYMHGIDGWRFCRLLRSSEYSFYNLIPILVISATFSGEEATRITKDIGANAFLSAPVRPKQLISQVRAALAGENPCCKLRVLIVEDDINFAANLKSTFRDNGFRADIMFGYRSAIEAFTNSFYDIAILDHHLPDGAGDLLLTELRNIRPECVCVMMTTDSSPELALTWMSKGAAAYLRKPFQPAYLFELCLKARRERTLLQVEDLLAKRSAELREAELRYRTLFDHSSDGILILDPATTLPIEYNEQTCRQLGYSREEFAYLQLSDIEALETQHEIRTRIRKAMDEGFDDFETLHRTKKGEIRHVHVTARMIDMSGKALYYCIWRDITEHKRAEELLHASEIKLRESYQLMSAILEHTHIMVAYLDTRFNFILVNRAYAETCQHEPAFFIGKNHFDLYPHQENQAIFQSVVDTGKPYFVTAKPFIFPDQPERGTTYWDWSLKPIKNSMGETTGLVFTLFDATDRVRAEKSMKQTSNELEWLLKSMINAFAILESVFDENGNFISYRFVYINDAYERITGVKKEEVQGKTVCEIWPGTTEKWIKKFGEVALTGIPQSFDMYHAPTKKFYHLNVYRPWETQDRFCVIFEDISERIRGEEALRQREDILNTTQRLTKIGGWEWNTEKRTMFWTEEVFAIHELPPDPFIPGSTELAAKSLQCYASDDRLKILSAFNACVDEGKAYDMEFPFTTFTGRHIWIRTGAKAIIHLNKVVRVVGYICDITSRKKTEMALRESKERYRMLFESMASAFALHELISDEKGAPADYRFLEVNQAFEKLTGLKADSIIGKTVREVLPNSDLFWIERYGHVVDSGETIHFEHYSKDLHRHYAGTAYRPHPNHFAVIFMDVTERKRSETERERLLSAIEQSGETIVITDSGGIIQYVNPSFELTTGYSRSEAIGQNPRILNSGTHDENFYKELWQTISSGENWQGRFINKRKNSTFYTEEASISPVKDSSGKIINYVAVKRDITDHLQIQEEKARLELRFQQIQKLESIGRLAGGVAHDFNNLLSPILGYGEMLLEDFSENDSRKNDVFEIIKAGKRARDLVRQLLAFSRKQVMELKPIDLNTVLAQFERLLRRTIREDISIAIIQDPHLPLINGDFGQLEQVIMNLAINAQDAMPHGGSLSIETGTVQVDEIYIAGKPGMRTGPYVRMAVSDTGEGMDEKIMSQIFEPFFTTKEKDQGTGLGLSTVYGIIKQHGASIWVYSEPGQGTTFKLYFPFSNSSLIGNDATEAKPENTGGSETILLVEDNEQVRNLAQAILTRHGYSLLIANDGIDALRILEGHPDQIDLVMTDVVMPGMSGKELYEHIISVFPKTKVLFMSGYTDNVIVHRGVLDEGVHFIQKPFSVNDLLLKVRDVLDENRNGSIPSHN